jgi:hypothetical protein
MKINNAIIRTVARDNPPISLVENEGFLQLSNVTAPLYKVTSRRSLTRLIDEKYTIMSEIFRNQLNSAEHATFIRCVDRTYNDEKLLRNNRTFLK